MKPDAVEMRIGVPDWAELDSVVRRPDPPALWPVGGQPLLAHWMDEARTRGASRVRIFCADRPHLVRAWLDGGVYWSCPVEVVPTPLERYPQGIEWADRLPGEEPVVAPRDGAALALWWHVRNAAWLASRDERARLLDELHDSGGWIGPRVAVHPEARIHPPCWIGAGTRVGARAQVGPGAVIGPRCVIEADAEVRDSTVLEDTFVGRFVALHQMVADGGLLVDAKRGCRVEIAESFILSGTSRREAAVPLSERALALLLWLPARVLALRRGGLVRRAPLTPLGAITLCEGLEGPLLARRAHWLGAVVAGRMRLIGPLPREAAAFEGLPTDAANLLRSVHPGVFSVADVHGCHVAGAGDEPTHALFSAAQPRSGGLVLRALPRLLFLVPA